jgi:hypothetical protein
MREGPRPLARPLCVIDTLSAVAAPFPRRELPGRIGICSLAGLCCQEKDVVRYFVIAGNQNRRCDPPDPHLLTGTTSGTSASESQIASMR